MTDDVLLTETRDRIAILTLNRPRQMNALSAELRRRFGETLAALGADDAVAAVIITGAGDKAFTAGVDLKELETAPLTAAELGPDSPVNRAFRALGKPTIAAVNGFAITGGLELAINCDILVASTSARFADTHARVGIVPGWGMSQLLPRLIGLVRARYMSYTGNFVDAATAKSWGLVLEVLPPDDLLPYCRRLATEVASCDRATQVITNLDIFAKVGKNRAYDVALPVSVNDGVLRIEFVTVKDNAKVSAILVQKAQ